LENGYTKTMPTTLRKILIAAGVLCIIAGGFLAWRASNPPLTDDQVILANLAAVQEAAQKRQAKNIAYYLAKDFSWQSTTRQEFVRMLSAGLFQARDVQVTLSKVELERQGSDEAVTSGNYSVTMRPAEGAQSTNAHGPFKFYWRKVEGEWKVYKAEGGSDIAG